MEYAARARRHALCMLMADFVAEVGDQKSVAFAASFIVASVGFCSTMEHSFVVVSRTT